MRGRRWPHPRVQGGSATDIGFIDRQGQRIQSLISRMQGTLTPEDLRLGRPECSDVAVPRPNGDRVHIVLLPALVAGESPARYADRVDELLVDLADRVRPVD